MSESNVEDGCVSLGHEQLQELRDQLAKITEDLEQARKDNGTTIIVCMTLHVHTLIYRWACSCVHVRTHTQTHTMYVHVVRCI